MKKLLLLFTLLCIPMYRYGQSLYIKLKKPIEQSQSLVNKVTSEYSVVFEKSELTSKLLDAHIY